MIELKASARLEQRISLITTLLNNADVKVNHFDGLRQRNLVMAMAIFAGLAGFTLRAPSSLQAIVTASALIVLMIAFLVLDHRLDKYNCGWQGTRKKFVRALRDVVNNPNDMVSFPQYHWRGERFATTTGLKSTIHVLLIAGSILILSYECWLRFNTLYVLLAGLPLAYLVFYWRTH